MKGTNLEIVGKEIPSAEYEVAQELNRLLSEGEAIEETSFETTSFDDYSETVEHSHSDCCDGSNEPCTECQEAEMKGTKPMPLLDNTKNYNFFVNPNTGKVEREEQATQRKKYIQYAGVLLALLVAGILIVKFAK